MPNHWTSIVDPKTLWEALSNPDTRSDIAVIDCRFSLADPDAGRSAYKKGRIPGARYAHLDNDLSGELAPGKTGRHPLPAPETFAHCVAQWGISNETSVVCYDDAGGAIAARLWWMMNWLGHDRVSVLNGGWTAWRTAGLPVSADPPDVSTGTFRMRLNADLLVSTEDVERSLGDGKTLLFDARDSARFSGEVEPLDPVAGHIPGARSLPFKENLTPNGLFRDPITLRDRFTAAGIAYPGTSTDSNAESNVVHYCGSGVTAAHNALAMKVAGYPIPRIYPGSWSEWITDPDRPIRTGSD